MQKVSFHKSCLVWIHEIQTSLKKKSSLGKKKSSPGKKKSNPGKKKSSLGKKKSNLGKKKSNPGKKKSNSGKKKSSPGKKKMVGGDNFVKDLQRSGKGLATAMTHTFESVSNLGRDMKCETDAIMNIGNEIDLGYSSKDCPVTKTKSWEWEQIKQ